MKRTAAYRFTSDICFYYSILSLFPSLFSLQKPMALFAAAALAVSLAAGYCPWAPVRLLLALLPGLAWLLAKPSFLLVFPALAWLYLILVLTAGRFHIWLDGYRNSFRIMMPICFFALLSGILLNMIRPGMAVILPGIAYAAAFLFFGAIAMRRLQMNADLGLRWNLANGAAVIGVPLLAVGFSLLLWQLLRLMQPVFDLLVRALRVALPWLINTLFPSHPDAPMPTPTPSPTLTPEEAAITEPGWDTPAPEINFDWEPDPARLELLAKIAAGFLLVLLVLFLVLLIVRRARRNRAKADQEDFLFEETEEGKPLRRNRKAEKAFASAVPARQIRILYRQYLKLMRRRGILIRRDKTSREILTEAELLRFSPDARRLRELYLKARYGDGSSVTFENVQEAVLCLQHILEEKGWKS